MLKGFWRQPKEDFTYLFSFFSWAFCFGLTPFMKMTKVKAVFVFSQKGQVRSDCYMTNYSHMVWKKRPAQPEKNPFIVFQECKGHGSKYMTSTWSLWWLLKGGEKVQAVYCEWCIILAPQQYSTFIFWFKWKFSADLVVMKWAAQTHMLTFHAT